ncbi:MAG: hypothetical protein RLZZ628_783 [Bacteroidota bacterium]
MKLNKPIIGIALLALVSHACKQDLEQFIVQRREILDTLADKRWNALPPALNDATIAVNQLFDSLALKPEIKTIDLTTGGTYSFSNGLTVRLGGSACTGSGGQIATGTGQLEVLILKTKGQMVQNRMETMSDGRLLESGGELFIRILQNNQALNLVNNQSITINYTISSIPNGTMSFFNGVEKSNGQVNWVLNRDSMRNTNIVSGRRDSVFNTNFVYQLTTNRLRWINCDYFRSDSFNLVKYCVQLPDSFTNVNTSVFTVFRNLNAMLVLQGDSTIRQFCVPNGYKGVPTGSAVTQISISRLGKDSNDFRYYLGTSDVNVTSNAVYPMSPVRKTLAEIKTFLNTL